MHMQHSYTHTESGLPAVSTITKMDSRPTASNVVLEVLEYSLSEDVSDLVECAYDYFDNDNDWESRTEIKWFSKAGLETPGPHLNYGTIRAPKAGGLYCVVTPGNDHNVGAPIASDSMAGDNPPYVSGLEIVYYDVALTAQTSLTCEYQYVDEDVSSMHVCTYFESLILLHVQCLSSSYSGVLFCFACGDMLS